MANSKATTNTIAEEYKRTLKKARVYAKRYGVENIVEETPVKRPTVASVKRVQHKYQVMKDLRWARGVLEEWEKKRKPEPPKEPEPDKNITELLAWLKETAKSYEWPGAKYFPDQEEIREETVMQGAKDIADEIEKVPRGKWPQLYKALKDSLGDVRDAIEDLVYMDYEEEGDPGNYCCGSWANNHYNDVMKSVLDIVKSFE